MYLGKKIQTYRPTMLCQILIFTENKKTKRWKKAYKQKLQKGKNLLEWFPGWVFYNNSRWPHLSYLLVRSAVLHTRIFLHQTREADTPFLYFCHLYILIKNIKVIKIKQFNRVNLLLSDRNTCRDLSGGTSLALGFLAQVICFRIWYVLTYDKICCILS